MGVLTERLVEQLINATTKEKEELGNNIVLKLGGDPTKSVKHLPKRRGNGDGGIDGRIPILRESVIRRLRPGGKFLYDSEVIEEEVCAAFCIKLEKGPFDRYQLGAFKNDMEREQIFEGIIISARELSPDAIAELERINKTGSFRIVHILLSGFIKGEFDVDFKFLKNPNEVFEESINEFLAAE